MRHFLLLLAWARFGLALFACAAVPYTRTPRPCQADAVALVWTAVYGRADKPPDVWWVPPAAQTCGRTINGARGFPAPVMVDGALVQGCAGASAAGGVLVNLVWYGSWQLTGLAHELAHIAQTRDGLPSDMAHTSADFQPGGRVAVANARLAAANLCPPQ